MANEEIYKKLEEAKKIISANREMEEEKDWSNPQYRKFFADKFEEDLTAYSALSQDVFRERINEKIKETIAEANTELYSNFDKILKDKKEEEIVDIMENIPLAINPEKLEAKLQNVAKLHDYLNTIKSLSTEDYKKMLLRKSIKEKKESGAYVAAGATEHFINIQRAQDILYHRNILIAELKKLKKKE